MPVALRTSVGLLFRLTDVTGLSAGPRLELETVLADRRQQWLSTKMGRQVIQCQLAHRVPGFHR